MIYKNMNVPEPVPTSRISFILGIKSSFNSYTYKPDSNTTNEYAKSIVIPLIQDFMKDHTELEDVSMTVTKVIGLYKEEYGCPEGGEVLYKMTSLYNPMHGQSKQAWYETILEYAKALSEYFHQSACTVIIENYDDENPLQCVYIKNEFDTTRKML